MFKQITKKYITLGIMLLVIFVTPLTSHASGTPSHLSYQGKLTDTGGNPLGGGGTTYYFKFSLWDSSTPGTGNQVWPATSPNSVPLTVKQGSFNVLIGDTDNGYPDTLDYDFNSNNPVYLQIEVSSDNNTFETLTPRSQLSSTAFSKVSESVHGTSDSSFGTTTGFADTLVSMLSTAIDKAVLTIKGAAGQVANLFNILDSNDNSLFTVTASGNVGVGTSTPSEKLVVNGNASLIGNLFINTGGASTANVYAGSASDASGWGGVWVGSNANTHTVSNYSILSNGGGMFFNAASGNNVYFRINNGDKAIITSTGNFGIGTSSPSAKLDVWGNLNVGTSSTPTLFVNTSNSSVGIGTSAPGGSLEIRTAGTFSDLIPSILAGKVVTTGNSLGASFRNFTGTTGNAMIEIAGITSGAARPVQLRTDSSGNFGVFTGSTAYSTLGTERFTVLQGGNIGINTTSPTSMLQINASSSTAIGQIIKGAASQTADLFQVQDSAGSSLVTIGSGGNIATAGSVSASNNGFIFNGSAGFGSFTRNSSLAELVVTTQNWSSANFGIVFGNAANTFYVKGAASQTGNLQEWRNSSGTALNVVTSIGRVGIGTTNPTKNLQVTGASSTIEISSTDNTTGPILSMTKTGHAGFTISNTSLGGGIIFNAGSGNTDYQHYQFQTGGITRMFINGTSGNIGIGTNSPMDWLEVASSTAGGLGGRLVISNKAARTDGNTAELGFKVNSNFAATYYSALISALQEPGATDNSSLAFYTYNSGAARGTEKMRITSGGNIGIATTTPGSLLTLGSGRIEVPIGTAAAPSVVFSGSTNAGLYTSVVGAFGISTGGTERILISAAGNIFMNNAGAIRGPDGTATNPGYSFGLSAPGTGMFRPSGQQIGFSINSVEKVRIDASGNVGIGTTAPTGGKLVVAGSGNTTLTIDNTTSGSAAICLDGNGGQCTGMDYTQLTVDTSGNFGINNQKSTGAVVLSTNNTERMRITSTGNVGIGTTATTKFHVLGDTTNSGGIAGLTTFGLSSSNASPVSNGFGWGLMGNLEAADGIMYGSGSFTNFWVDSGAAKTSGWSLSTRAGSAMTFVDAGLGLGTASPSKKLHIYGTDNSFRLTYPSVADWDTTVNSSGTFGFAPNNGSNVLSITAGGNVGIGTTTPAFPLDVYSTVSSNQTYGYLNSSGLVGTSAGTNSYSIRAQGRILAQEFNAVSDARLKNVQFDLGSDIALDAIKKLKPVSFTWKDSSNGQPVLGFLAQDVELIIPNAVSKVKGAFFDDQRTLDYNQIVAVLVGAVKEIANKIEGFKDEFRTNKLCVGDTCITEDQLKVLLENQNIQSDTPTSQTGANATSSETVDNSVGGSNGSGDSGSSSNESASTPEPTQSESTQSVEQSSALNSDTSTSQPESISSDSSGGSGESISVE